MLRLCAAGVALAVGIILAVLCYRLLGPSNVAHVLAATALLGGFAAFRVARTPAAPARPLRITLATSVALTLLMLSSMPWPWERPAASTWGPLALGLCAALALSLRPRASGWPPVLMLLLGAYGLFVMIRTPWFIATTTNFAGYRPEAIALSLTLATALGASWVAAAWHYLTLRSSASASGEASAFVAP